MYRTAPVVAALGLSLALAACGGGGSSGASTTGGVKSSAASGGAVVHSTSRRFYGRSRKGHSAARSPGQVEYETEPTAPLDVTRNTAACRKRIGDLVDRMDDLRQSLVAGLDYSEYVLRVQAIRAAYEAVPVDRLDAACVTGPAADAEDAFNQYLRAANLWGECAGTAGCAASSIEARLQHRWRVASKSLRAAKRSN